MIGADILNIIVCVKQVPATTEVKMNKETNTIIREGVESIVNPFDEYAIEEGLRLRDKHGGKVTAISMGIPSVADLLKETIAFWNQEGKWEEHPNDQRRALLNNFGKECWELVHVTGVWGDLRFVENLNVPSQLRVTHVYFFKRELVEEKKGD